MALLFRHVPLCMRSCMALLAYVNPTHGNGRRGRETKMALWRPRCVEDCIPLSLSIYLSLYIYIYIYIYIHMYTCMYRARCVEDCIGDFRNFDVGPPGGREAHHPRYISTGIPYQLAFSGSRVSGFRFVGFNAISVVCFLFKWVSGFRA